MSNNNWTSSEDLILINNWNKGLEELIKLLPNRTKSSIKNRCFKLGLTKKNHPHWSINEDNILKKYYPIMGGKIIEKIPNRSIREIYSRACILGVSHNKKWTYKESKIVEDFYCSSDPDKNIFEMLPNVSVSSIYSKANSLKLNRTHKWSEEDIRILKEYYPKIGIKVSDMLPNRTKGAIGTKVYNMGLKVNRK